MSTTYTYTIATAFLNGVVDPTSFSAEIKASSVASAVLERIDTASGDCMMTFTNALSSPQQTTLQSLAAAHTGVPFDSKEQRATSEGVTQRATPGTTDKLTFQSASVVAGWCRVSWYAEYRITTATKDTATVTTLVNGTPVAEESVSTVADWQSAAGFYELSVAAGAKLSVILRLTLAGAGGAAAEIRRARITVDTL